jgi:hypothetical protein
MTVLRNDCENSPTLKCDVCRLAIFGDAFFAVQERGSGPYVGMSGWYIATTHVDPCGQGFLVSNPEYQPRRCRGCGRAMWLRPGARRTHCSNACRQSHYRRRQELPPWLGFDERNWRASCQIIHFQTYR